MAHMLGIGAVERDTGLAKDVLRIWERRYGFPVPERDAQGDRCYPAWQVDKLRLLRKLIDTGHRPGKIMNLSSEALCALLARDATTARARDGMSSNLDPAPFLESLKTHDPTALRELLLASLMRTGLENFVLEVAAPLCGVIGDAWARGEIEVYQEHLFTEQISRVLLGAINALPRRATADGKPSGPCILLASFPQEQHALGLLMAEALMSLADCNCIALGPQTPLPDIAGAATAHHVDIVALSFSTWFGSRQLVEGLADLRKLLPEGIELWLGGAHPALGKHAADGVRITQDLRSLPLLISEWRRARGA